MPRPVPRSGAEASMSAPGRGAAPCTICAVCREPCCTWSWTAARYAHSLGRKPSATRSQTGQTQAADGDWRAWRAEERSTTSDDADPTLAAREVDIVVSFQHAKPRKPRELVRRL